MRGILHSWTKKTFFYVLPELRTTEVSLTETTKENAQLREKIVTLTDKNNSLKEQQKVLTEKCRQLSRESAVPTLDFWVWLRNTQNIRTLIDIGANDGAFGQFIAGYFNASSVYAFEPLPSCVPEIERRFSNIPDFKAFNLALSDYTGTETLYQNSYAPASSLLRVSTISRAEFPQTTGETPITVQVMTLDDVLNADNLNKDIFIKIDVQGMEDRVIRGGKKVFSQAKCVLVEMSFVSMYEGQPLFEEVHMHLVELGFRFSGIKNQINSEKTGRPLFCHCLYVHA